MDGFPEHLTICYNLSYFTRTSFLTKPSETVAIFIVRTF